MAMREKKEKMDEFHGCMHGGCCHGYMKLAIGVFVFLIGFAWLGNDMGWWVLYLPWFPLIVTFFGLSMIAKWYAKRNCCCQK